MASTGYSSIMKGATFGRNGHAPEVGGAHAQIRNVFAAGIPAVQDLDVGAHLREACRSARCGSGSSAHSRW